MVNYDYDSSILHRLLLTGKQFYEMEWHIWLNLTWGRISNSLVPVHIPVAALFLVRSFFSVSCTDLDQEANDRAGSRSFVLKG